MSETYIIGKAATQIGSFLGIIDDVNSNVKKLLHEPFKHACNCLEYAKNANTIEETKQYITDARKYFETAVTNEEDENKVDAYYGLALCQYLLGSYQNAKVTISKIDGVTLSNGTINKKIAVDVTTIIIIAIIFLFIFPVVSIGAFIYLSSRYATSSDNFTQQRKKEFYKHKALVQGKCKIFITS